jgi:predicted nucleic acid-binding protein
MVYVDTSVLVPLFIDEPHSEAVADWYAREKQPLVAAVWCLTEFASALSLKQRTGAIDAAQARAAWKGLERLVASDLRLLPVEPADFHRAAALMLEAATALRAGDALHLACAEAAGARRMATLDEALGRNAKRMKMVWVIGGPRR